MAEMQIGPGDWLRSVPAAARDLRRGHTHCVRDRLGVPLRMSDGRTYVPFRHTRKGTAFWRDEQPPAVLQPRFHLGPLPARRRRLHRLFRVVCMITTPFFVGLPGFRSKLWMVDPATGDFAGLYEWDDPEAARAYAEGLSKLLRLLSSRGSVTYELVAGTTVDEYLMSTQGSCPSGGPIVAASGPSAST